MALSLHPFRPYLLKSLSGYGSDKFTSDLIAGITVGIVALPLAMAFAIASGVPPAAGIFSAIVGGFIISALGGSRVQIGGPAGAFIVIVYGIIAQVGLAGLLIATLMAGVLLFLMGLLRVGSLIRFIPVAIIIGFTNGIAVLIALSQVKDFLGLAILKPPADFFGLTRALGEAFHTINPQALALALGCLFIIIVWPHLLRAFDRKRSLERGRVGFMSRLPATLIALGLATLATVALDLRVETIGSRFGGIPQGFPQFAALDFSSANVRLLIAPALTIAMLGAIESLLCARVADGMINDRHDPNQELMAQGIANMVTPFFGGIPVTGTIARTTTNVRTGAASPVAGMIHAAVLLIIVLIAAPLAAHVPLAALAAILMFVAWNMGEWREFARLKSFTTPYRVTMLATFTLTVVADLTVAIEVGMVLACLFFIYRVVSLTEAQDVPPDSLPAGTTASADVRTVRLFGSLFFGSVGKLEALLERDEGVPLKALVLDMHHVINVDSTGLDALAGLNRALAARGARLMLCDLNAQPRSLIERLGFAAKLGDGSVWPTLAEAMRAAQALPARS